MRTPRALPLAVVLLSAAPALALNADDLVAKNAAARGGLERLRAMRTLVRAGKLIVNGGQLELDFRDATRRNDGGGAYRSDYALQGLTSVRVWDGREGWRVNPFGGRKDPERTSPEDSKGEIEAAEIDGPLVDAKKKGHTLSYLGVEDVDGTGAHKLRVVRKNGDVQTFFLDPATFLEIRIETQRTVRGSIEESVADLGAWGEVGGVLLPFSIEVGSKRSSERNQIRYQTTDVDVAVDDAVFRFPGAGGPAPMPTAATKPRVPVPPPPSAAAPFDAGTLSGLGARNIGSAAMSGRIAALAATAEPDGRATVFVAAASGGVWKSTDGGTTFRPVFDDAPVQSIGAVAIDPTRHNVVWVGTGESWTRNSVSIGNGIYKSTDGGETFVPMGLPESERISRIVVDPRAGDVVWACVPGKLWSDSADRGLYKTTDGGKTWTLVLKGQNASTGCGSVDLDPKDSNVVFASLWDFRRKGWTFRSGGDGPSAPSGSGLFRSGDGGKTWTEIAPKTHPGFAQKPYGRIAVAVAPTNGKRIYAAVESTSSALYVSDDGGKTWEARDRSQWMVWRPFYFQHLIVDPTNADRVFKTNGALILSEDAGRSFAVVGGFGGMHGDVHDVWVNPRNTRHVLAGDDGGFWLSYDGGNRWWKGNNLPVSQFYHVSVDEADPYHVYGGLQDNASWVGDSQYPGGITNSRWEAIYWGDGFWVLPDPSDPNYVYAESQGGYIARIHRGTHQARDIQPKAKKGEKLRYNWNTPIAMSPHKKGTLYLGAQFLFRSRDHGQNWERISPDLTTNDPEKQKQEQSGGVTVDNSAAEMHTTIYAIAESPEKKGLIWVGTDDGNLQVTRNAGKRWTNVVAHVPDLPPASWVSWVEPSPHDAGTAFVAFDRHTMGDMSPWLYVTHDFGKSFSALVSPRDAKGIRGWAHVIRQDPVKPGLLFLGTELGLWISIDGGVRWAPFRGGRFPAVAVRDIAIQKRAADVVLGTHGRGIWILDDITPLRGLDADAMTAPIAVLEGRRTEQRIGGPGGWANGSAVFIGENPPDGAVITYHQADRHMFGSMSVEILDPAGKVIDTPPAGLRRGLNRVLWSMRMKPPHVPRAVALSDWGTNGVRVLPGIYTVRITKGTGRYERKLVVALDDRAQFSKADRKAQFDAAMKVYALFADESAAVERLARLRDAVALRRVAAKDQDLRQRLTAFDDRANAIKKRIVATTEGGAITGEERLREHTDSLYGALLSYEGRPGGYHLERIAALRSEVDAVTAAIEALLGADLAGVNDALKKGGLEPIAAPPREAMNDVTPERAAWLRGQRGEEDEGSDDDKVPAHIQLR